MSEIQKGRPTIYGEVQFQGGAPADRECTLTVPRARKGMQENDGALWQCADERCRPSGLGNRARTEQAPRRRTSVSALEAYTAPLTDRSRVGEHRAGAAADRFCLDSCALFLSVPGILAVLGFVAAIIYEVVLETG